MKKRIGIYVGSLYFPAERIHKWDENNLQSGGIGGSEIWAIELASQLEAKGYHVMVFADCEMWHYAVDGVEYIPENCFDVICKYTKFDYFITSRRTYELSEAINCENIYIMAHDPFILWAENYNSLHMDLVKKITYQSDFQKEELKKKYAGLTDDDFFRTFQAINPSLYKNADQYVKKNKMLWSSHKIRGARILIEKILPLIRKWVPDFEIDVCGYVNDIEDNYFKAEGVNILGNISKEELCRRQMESKIWIYPNWGKFEDGRINDETFCITAIENAFAKNALFVADRTCFSTTLNGYDGFVGTHLFGDSNILDESLIDDFAQEIANVAVKALTDDAYRIKLAENAYEICKEYTWENAAETFINEFENGIKPIRNNAAPSIKKDLILMTGVFRVDNLHKVFQSIKEIFKSNNVNITWLLCYDQHNAKGDISSVLEECKKYQNENPSFGWLFFPVGEDNNPHYGGDLFNGPLQWIKKNWFPSSDPWVYILDDDNTVCPLMGERINEMLTCAETKDKNVVYLNIMYENGIIAPVCNNTFFYECTRTGWIPYYVITDPSQIITKYSCIEDFGFYSNKLKYDEDIFHYLINHVESMCFPEEWHPTNDFSLNRYQTTHNGISSKEDIDKWYDVLSNDNIAKNCALTVCTNDGGNKAFNVDSKIIKEIFEKYLLNE